jgi:hypothetical protein
VSSGSKDNARLNKSGFWDDTQFNVSKTRPDPAPQGRKSLFDGVTLRYVSKVCRVSRLTDKQVKTPNSFLPVQFRDDALNPLLLLKIHGIERFGFLLRR